MWDSVLHLPRVQLKLAQLVAGGNAPEEGDLQSSTQWIPLGIKAPDWPINLILLMIIIIDLIIINYD